MRRTRLLFLFILLLSVSFNAGCGLRQRYKVDRPEKNINQTQRYSKKSNHENSANNTSELIELGRLIQSYLGRPYIGKSRHTKGYDCSQFMRELFSKYDGTRLPRTVKEQAKLGYNISKGDIQYGDLVFFRTDGRRPSHVGVYVGFDEFVHSSTSSGIVISSLKNKYWKKRLLFGRRIIR